jgi:hypothetical protein
MIRLISVLDKLLNLLQFWVVRQKQEKIQEARDEIENNPANWFEHHFSGVPTDKSNKDEAK